MNHALLIRTAMRWKIRPDLATAVISRDDNCIYCRRLFEDLGPRTAWPSWEHIVNDESLVNAANIALCCVGCNASKGNKTLEKWLTSKYCVERGITSQSMAAIALSALRAAAQCSALPREEELPRLAVGLSAANVQGCSSEGEVKSDA